MRRKPVDNLTDITERLTKKRVLGEIRTWWEVDVIEHRTVVVRATGPNHAKSVVALAIGETSMQTSVNGEPDVIRSIKHTAKIVTEPRKPRMHH